MPTRTRTRWILGLVGAWVLIGCTVQRPVTRYDYSVHFAAPAPLAVPAKEIVMVGGPRLPHDIHAANEIGCVDCHVLDEETGRPTMPTWEICSMCHEDMDAEFEKDEEKVQARFFDAEGAARWTKAIQAYGDNVIWGHKQHAGLEDSCKACHASMLTPLAETPSRPAALLFDMAGCEACHAERKAPAACATCHQELSRTTPPPTHLDETWRATHGRASLYLRESATAQQCSMCHDEPAFCNDCHARTQPSDHQGTGWRMLHGQAVLSSGESLPARCAMCHTSKRGFCDACHQQTPPRDHSHVWEKRHGQMVRAAGANFPARCAMCHKERAFCEKCHLDEPPTSHTTLFRTRTHGLLAAMDRQTCATCHTTPFCVRCHQDTAPRSHRAGWSMGRNTHCVQCHFPITMAPNCRVCHQGNPTHSTAPSQPLGHIPGRNCRVCHNALGAGGARPMRHLDNGQNCETCHQ